MRRFLPAIGLSAFVILTAPFVGLVRNWLFDAFPRAALAGLGLLLGGLALAAFVFALTRIRHHRGLRYGGLLLLGLAVAAQTIGFSDPQLEVNLIEKVHIFEYGLLVILLYRAFGRRDAVRDLSDLALPLLWVVFSGTLDEWMQLLVETRLGYIADVWLNVFSGACGLVFLLCLEPPAQFSWRFSRWPLLGRSAAVAALTLGLFYCDAHLGHLIVDPGIGSFRSWHSREQLRATAAERTGRWARQPPGEASPWRLEDRYLTEAGWHSRNRDRSVRQERFYWARQENRILEAYFGPYLDLENFRRKPRRRYPPQRVAELEAAAPHAAAGEYDSPVLKTRVHVWISKPAFLGLLLPTALLLWILPRLWSRRADPAG